METIVDSTATETFVTCEYPSMGFFDGVRAFFQPADPLVAWQQLTDDDALQAARTKLFLERLAASIDSPLYDIRVDPLSPDAELHGEVEGLKLLVKLRTSGHLDGVELTYQTPLAPLNMTYDRDAEENEGKVPDDEVRHFQGPNVYVCDPRKVEEFRALPETLRKEIVDTMRSARIRSLDTSEDEADVQMWDDVNVPSGIARLSAAIALLVKVVKLRIVLHHRKPKADQRSRDDIEGFDTIRDMAFGRGGGNPVKVDHFAKAAASRVPGSRVVDRPEEGRVEIRWLVGGVPTRVAVELREDSFPTVTAGVRLEGVSSSFELLFDPHANATAVDDDGWAESERRVFFDKAVFVSSVTTSADAAFLQSLPVDVLGALVSLCGHRQQTIVLDEQVLAMDVGLLFDHQDGAEAIRTAEILATAGAAIPKGDFRGTHAVPVRCTYCKAHFFRTPADPNCKHCGAPS